MLTPPQPVVPQAPPPAARGLSRGMIALVVVLGMLVAALGGVIVAREMGAPAEVALEPVATAGANPFMDSVGTDVPDVRPVAHTGGRHSGTTPGLYGGTGDDSSCDRSQLTRYLSAHPDRAAGWASVLGLRDGSSSTISSYVDGLTSVVLRSDTYVTNHGWSDGSVTSWPAVLQAGTAVLVDPYGNPVTRCFCGNPLTAPQSFTTVAYVGPRWTSFTSNSVTIINHQTTTVTNNYTIIDVHTGRGHDRPRGTDGERDRENREVREAFPGGAEPQAGGGAQAGAENGGGSAPDVVAPAAGGEGATGVAPGGAGPGTSTSPGSSTTTSTGPESSTTTTTPSTSGAGTTLAGTSWTAGSGCSFGPGTVTFGSGGRLTGTVSGTYTASAGALSLTTSSGSTTFDLPSASTTTLTSLSTPACTLTSTSS
ncbi:DUF6777 domain-containing protein [Actinomycetospora callitridis]|uniref:DUF6777 domain-containing protein n=1 Tax=Actinomycetospora callitridis TaxID=913944 RepID=UPI002365CFB3|nr:DUF6777 domain-containing protein [Actinomycetospora callitridis]MDD7919358.1 hypothetical protein [Actinomycetospora callitridis]